MPSLIWRRALITVALMSYSALMLAALMIGHHLSISAFWKPPSAAGVCGSRGVTSGPSSVSRVGTAGVLSASMTAALSFVTTSFGVSLGTQSPYQSDA